MSRFLKDMTSLPPLGAGRVLKTHLVPGLFHELAISERMHRVRKHCGHKAEVDR